jgi:hypothetical protein
MGAVQASASIPCIKSFDWRRALPDGKFGYGDASYGAFDFAGRNPPPNK